MLLRLAELLLCFEALDCSSLVTTLRERTRVCRPSINKATGLFIIYAVQLNIFCVVLKTVILLYWTYRQCYYCSSCYAIPKCGLFSFGIAGDSSQREGGCVTFLELRPPSGVRDCDYVNNNKLKFYVCFVCKRHMFFFELEIR